MLHLETYAPGTKDNAPWYQGKPRPPEVLNPTEYLRLAAELTEDAQTNGTSGQVAKDSHGGGEGRVPALLLGGAVVTALAAGAVAAVRSSREDG